MGTTRAQCLRLLDRRHAVEGTALDSGDARESHHRDPIGARSLDAGVDVARLARLRPMSPPGRHVPRWRPSFHFLGVANYGAHRLPDAPGAVLERGGTCFRGAIRFCDAAGGPTWWPCTYPALWCRRNHRAPSPTNSGIVSLSKILTEATGASIASRSMGVLAPLSMTLRERLTWQVHQRLARRTSPEDSPASSSAIT